MSRYEKSCSKKNKSDIRDSTHLYRKGKSYTEFLIIYVKSHWFDTVYLVSIYGNLEVRKEIIKRNLINQ